MSDESSGVRVGCFDLGGVVVRLCRNWEEACVRAGVEVRDSGASHELLRMRRAAVRAYQSGVMDCQEYFQTIAKSTGDLYDAQEVEQVHKAWICEDYEGVEAMVEELREQVWIVTACLSNTNQSHWRILTQSDGPHRPASPAVNRIEKRLVSHELGLVKPDAAMYECALKALSVEAREIVFFDDTGENIDAALAHGWRAFEIDHRGDPAAQMRDHLTALGVLDG